MVHVKDEGIFEEPIEKIWRFNGDEKAPHAHTALRNRKVVKQEGASVWIDTEVRNPDGKTYSKVKWKLTMNPPKDYIVEYIDGAMKGTKFTNSYTALGATRTKVNVEGNWVIPGMNEADARKSVLGFLDMVFTEDTGNLKKYK